MSLIYHSVKAIFLRRERGKLLLHTHTHTHTISFYVILPFWLKAPRALTAVAPPLGPYFSDVRHYLVKYLISAALCNYMPFNKWVISVSGTKADLFRQLQVGFRAVQISVFDNMLIVIYWLRSREKMVFIFFTGQEMSWDADLSYGLLTRN